MPEERVMSWKSFPFTGFEEGGAREAGTTQNGRKERGGREAAPHRAKLEPGAGVSAKLPGSPFRVRYRPETHGGPPHRERLRLP